MGEYMDECRKTEERFKEAYGHSSLCNCIRKYRGRYIVTRRTCSCGSDAMTREKAYKIATDELGEMTKENHAQVVARIKGLES